MVTALLGLFLTALHKEVIQSTLLNGFLAHTISSLNEYWIPSLPPFQKPWLHYFYLFSVSVFGRH
jgi:hypothetical protein